MTVSRAALSQVLPMLKWHMDGDLVTTAERAAYASLAAALAVVREASAKAPAPEGCVHVDCFYESISERRYHQNRDGRITDCPAPSVEAPAAGDVDALAIMGQIRLEAMEVENPGENLTGVTPDIAWMKGYSAGINDGTARFVEVLDGE